VGVALKHYNSVDSPHRSSISLSFGLHFVRRLWIGVLERTGEKGIGRRSVGRWLGWRGRGRRRSSPLPLDLYVGILVKAAAAVEDVIPATALT
jgi:hypothetical protein